MEIVVAIVAAAFAGVVIGGLFHLRMRNTVFAKIRVHVTLASFFLLLAFFLFGLIGLNIWSITILPIVSLLIILLIIKSGISKLLEVK
jgi:hypothetical protein